MDGKQAENVTKTEQVHHSVNATESEPIHPKVNACGQVLTSERASQLGKMGGRPISIERYLRKLLRQRAPDGKRNATHVAKTLIQAASDGDIAAAKLLLDRIDGPVIQRSIVETTSRQLRIVVRRSEAITPPDLQLIAPAQTPALPMPPGPTADE